MIHPNDVKLARILADYSVAVKKGDKVLISANEAAKPLAQAVYQRCLLVGAFPHLIFSPGDLDYFFFKNASQAQLNKKPEIGLFLAQWADKFIRLFSANNNSELKSIDPKRLMQAAKAQEPVKKIMLKKPWVLTEYPSLSMAQTAGLSLSQLEELYFKACLQDWPAVGRKLTNLKRRLDNAKKIEVIGPQTHLTLSFTNRYFAICDGKFNLPDGEIFSAPVESKVDGEVYFDLPSLRSGNVVEKVRLTFRAGRVVKATAAKGERYLKAALASDAGAKRLGEFAIGANYGIKRPMLNTLFDEKIGGTVHMALGSSYPDLKDGGGKNQSSLHWDLVKTMTAKESKVLVNGRPVLAAGKLLV